MFVCPNCRSRLIRSKNEKGIYWQCSCGGRALTLALLRRVVDRDQVNALWKLAQEDKGGQGRDCPSCTNSMLEIFIDRKDQEERQAIDVCKRCHFVWFDAKELEQLPERPADPDEKKEQELSPEARKMMALAKLEMKDKQLHIESDFLPDAWWKALIGLFGMPVEETNPPTKTYPIGTWLLAIITIVISVMAFSDLPGAVKQYGFTPGAGSVGITVFTYFFIHASIIHLVGNMYFLLVFGDNVEDYLGTAKFLTLVFLASVFGALLHGMFDPRGDLPLVGASGGISAIIIVYALRFPYSRLGIFFFLWPVYFRWFVISTGVAACIWIGLQILGAFYQAMGVSSVSAFAHLGGAIIGFGFWRLFKNEPVSQWSKYYPRNEKAA